MKQHKLVENTLAGLDTVWLLPKGKPTGVLCLFHGYGASAQNLARHGLVSGIQIPTSVAVALPNGFLPRHPGQNTDLFAWWTLDLDRMIEERRRLQAVQSLHLLYDEQPPGLHEARHRVQLWLDEVIRSLGLTLSRTVLGGFSQGAMLATDLALHLPAPCAGLGVFSGALINRAAWATCLATAPVVPRFQSHGVDDPVLPFTLGEALHEFLQQSPLAGEFMPFAGGHEIPDAVASAWGQCFSKWLLPTES